MVPQHMPVATRVNEIKKVFQDFGIAIAPNSILEQTINAEFGRGKRSVLTKIITDLQQDSDAAVLAECIGHALAQHSGDPQIAAIAKVMQQRVPSLLQICDIRQHTVRRIELVQQLLSHFEQKIQANASTTMSAYEERILRSIKSAREQVQGQMQLQAAGAVIYHVGIVCNVKDLKRFGKIFEAVTPLLVAFENSNNSKQQIIEHGLHALRAVSNELQKTQLIKIASILDDIYNLSQALLPGVAEIATVQNILASAGVSVGTITLHKLSQSALKRGITEKELANILYRSKELQLLESRELALLEATHQNQRYAAACSLVTKIGQEVECKPLENIGIAGMCLVCMRQTYYELKTQSLNFASFSESLGLLVTGVGVVSKNSTLIKIGGCILEGVKMYSGIMAIPGGQSVAIPLAVCAALGKLVLGNNAKPNGPETINEQQLLQQLLQQVINLHYDMRRQFQVVFNLLQAQHQEYLTALEQGFSQLECFVRYANVATTQRLQNIEHKIDEMRLSVSKEFSDLYLEYIQDPIQEIEYLHNYQQVDAQNLHKNKYKLSMWLLYKARHRKANGRDLIALLENSADLSNYVAMILRKINSYDGLLGMINRYINLELQQELPEELPHLPSWLMSANIYVYLLQQYAELLRDQDKEPKLLQDIIAIGEQVLGFVEMLAANESLLYALQTKLSEFYNIAKQEYNKHAIVARVNYLAGIATITQEFHNAFDFGGMLAYANSAEQLEAFDPVTINVTEIWKAHFSSVVPAECLLAQHLGLGSILITYTVDAVNDFHSTRIAYAGGQLPDQGRDVLYRLDLFFKTKADHKTLLATAWFAYDLGNAQRRFDEYYQRKFKYGLRLYRYLWISLNGRQNQVQGHGVTETHKLIEYQRLASVYQEWWYKAQPVNVLDIQIRLRQNLAFMQKTGGLLDENKFMQVHIHNIELLKLQLMLDLQGKVFEKRIKIVTELQASRAFNDSISKIDAYSAILLIYGQILNCDIACYKSPQTKVAAILQQIPEDNLSRTDFATALQELFDFDIIELALDKYQTGIFYKRVEYILAKLRLQLTTMQPVLWI
jgi:hypothetical protein